MRLADKTVIITGAGSGIGLALAERCLVEGAAVVAVDRDEAGMAGLSTPHKLSGDVRDTALAEQAVALATSETGGLHGLATVAGVSGSGVAIDQITSERWDEIYSVNVKATWLWLVASLPAFRRQTGILVRSQVNKQASHTNCLQILHAPAISPSVLVAVCSNTGSEEETPPREPASPRSRRARIDGPRGP